MRESRRNSSRLSCRHCTHRHCTWQYGYRKCSMAATASSVLTWHSRKLSVLSCPGGSWMYSTAVKSGLMHAFNLQNFSLAAKSNRPGYFFLRADNLPQSESGGCGADVSVDRPCRNFFLHELFRIAFVRDRDESLRDFFGRAPEPLWRNAVWMSFHSLRFRLFNIILGTLGGHVFSSGIYLANVSLDVAADGAASNLSVDDTGDVSSLADGVVAPRSSSWQTGGADRRRE